MFEVKSFGDWARHGKVFRGLSTTIDNAARSATRAEAEYLKGRMIDGILTGRPGGVALAPLSPLTVLFRQARGLPGNAPLNATNRTAGQIVVVAKGDRFFVGVSGDRAPIMAMQAAGFQYTRPWTPKQRAFFFATLKRAGVEPRSRGGSTSGALSIPVPPRPFMQLVMQAEAGGTAAKLRYAKNFARASLGVFSAK
jgi:hypothetical protein